MLRSYEKIHYGLRPAKNIERKMLAEAFRRLSEFGTIESYRYIGFGSTYFSDFSLFHKSLGITNMLSIEWDAENDERFRFNRPFRCVQIRFGDSNQVLPTLSWNERTILWLDYDRKLDCAVLTDVSWFCAHAVPGSAILVTVNAKPDRFDQEPLQQLRDRVGEEKVSPAIQETELSGWGTADVYRRIITNEIQEKLDSRNGGRSAGSRMLYRQLFNFRYADGPKMLTVGGLLFEEGQSNIVGKCAFETLPFVKTGEEPYLIEVPNLTFRELRYLDAQLPISDPRQLDAPSIPEKDLERYARVYRYFPAFVDAEL